MKPITVNNTAELGVLLASRDDDDEMNYEEFSIECESIGANIIITAGPAYFLKEEGLLVIEGVYMNKEEDGYVADWALTLVYEWEDENKEFDAACAKNYIYFEQDPPVITLHNFLRITKPE